jgi:anaerobic ribonucleoside-triphosphate reductase
MAETKEVIECPRCGFEMKNMTACHMICPNCGANYDCSDKGGVW